jgi:type I restriction enzyme S subunit
MGEWKECILEDVIEKFIDYRGKTPKKIECGIPLVTAKIVKAGRISEPNEFIAAKDYYSWMSRGLPEIDDIVLTTEAPLGEIALIKDKNVALAQRVITLRGDKNIVYNPFLKYYFQSSIGQYELQSRASGTTVFGIKAAVLKKVPVILPSLHEQKAIASVLSSLDDKIDLLHRQNKTLEAMAETLFRQWFVEEAQDDWEERRLGDYINIKHGYAFKGAFITTEKNNKVLVTPGNFNIGGGFKFGKMKYLNSSEYPYDFVFSSDDLVVTMTDLSKEGDTLGYPALIPKHNRNEVLYLHNQRVGKVEFKKEISKYFVYYLMKTNEYQWFILGGASGTSVRHTSPTSICEYSFKVPSLERLNYFNEIAEGMMSKVHENQIQIDTLEKLRDTLLPKLMSGEVRVEYDENKAL